MSSLQELKSNVKKKRQRVGRGNSAGQGTHCGRGMKGQNARNGGPRRPGFEGGQTPFSRRMPKIKGFKNINHVEYQVVNVEALNIFDNGTEVTPELMYTKKLIAKKDRPVKLLSGKSKYQTEAQITFPLFS